jgi:hypothetical protein
MQQGTPQFTPLQMLEAGRQAEAESKIDFAVQFYLHLVEFYGQTPEAAEARTALTRMANTGLQQQQLIWHAGGTKRPVRYRSGRVLAALVSGLGWLLILGAVTAAAAAVGAYVLQLTFLQSLEVDPQRVVWRLPLVALAGGALVICGQAARALFEQANATRELLTIQRRRFGQEQP